MPELFRDGMEKIVGEALPAFDLLPRGTVETTLAEAGLPREAMSPFLPYVERRLSLERVVRLEELVPDDGAVRRQSLAGEWAERAERSTGEGAGSASAEAGAAPNSWKRRADTSTRDS